MAEPPLAVYGVASDLLTCASARLALTPAGLPARVGVVAGQVAWDDCECPGGMLAVTAESMFPTRNFPTPDTQVPRCGQGLTAVVYGIWVLRCAPGAPGRDMAPTVEQLDATARVVYEDAYAVWRGVLCCLAEMSDELESVTSGTTFVGPEGSCAGSVLRVTVGLDDTCLCDDG